MGSHLARCVMRDEMTEAQLRDEVVKLAHARAWRVFSMPIAKSRRPVKDASGYPDLTLARMGRVLWIELKQERGLLSQDQMRWLQELSPLCEVIRPSDLGTDRLRMLLA